MALASSAQFSFLGGEISQAAQGRMDLPSYKISMNVCLNGIPIEAGAWQRRPGTRHAGTTRSGKPAREISFAFQQTQPYRMEFSDANVRFRVGNALVTTNDDVAIVSISTANPAVVTTAAQTWTTNNQVFFNNLGTVAPLLQGRLLAITRLSSATFSIADAITGATIDGSTLGFALAAGMTVSRVLDIATPYVSTDLWTRVRSIQAERQAVLVNGAHPQILTAVTPPSSAADATFTLANVDFLDGPYLDPFPSSVITPGTLNGVVTLTLSFKQFDGARAYAIGDYVTYLGVSYVSLTSPNTGNPPDVAVGNWLAVNPGIQIGPNGFTASDIGRLIRLFSEPQPWTAGTYNTTALVKYAGGYWIAQKNGVTNTPGLDPASWQPVIGAAVARWTWAQITSISSVGIIPGVPANTFGSMIFGGGIGAAFDGNTSKNFAAAASFLSVIATYPAWNIAQPYSFGSLIQYQGVQYQAIRGVVAGSPPPPILNQTEAGTGNFYWQTNGTVVSPTFDIYVGQRYFGGQRVSSATLFATTDLGYQNEPNGAAMTVNLRGKVSATTLPTSPSDGVLLGSVTFTNTASSINIPSNDTTTAFNFVWVEFVLTFTQPLPQSAAFQFAAEMSVAQIQFFAPNVNNGAVVNAQIRGDPLLYTQQINIWRLGAYSDTTGWPTCGTYHEGRILLTGAIDNRIDLGVSNGLLGNQIDFAPTEPDGTVTDANAITYTFNSDDVNPIFWATPDQQGIICGTQAGEWLVQATTQNLALSPTNIQAHRVTKIGCANIEPKRAEHTLLIVQKFGREIVEYFPDVFSGKFTAPNLAKHAKHLTVSGIREIAYQQELAPIVWARRGDGVLVGATYKRDTLMTSQGPTFVAWHRHVLGSGRLVESLCVGPSHNGDLDAVSLVTNDPVAIIRHVEYMGDLLDEGFLLTDCGFLDDAIVPSSTLVQLAPTGGPYGSLVVNGLWAHNGKTVTAWIAGLDCGEFTVASGSITIPFGDSVSGGTGSGLLTATLVQGFPVLPALIGFNYNSDGQTVRAVDVGPQGTTFAKNQRFDHIGVQLYGCVNGTFALGTDFTTMYPAKLWQPNDVPYTVQQLWSGIYRDAENGPYDFDGMIAWRISRPYPAFVTAIGGQRGGG